MGTKVRFLQSANPNELQGLIEALPFKVEIKSIQFVGGKWYCWFTLLQNDSFVMDAYPSNEDKIPPAKKSQKTKKKKIK